MSRLVGPGLALWRREVIRFFRQPSRVVGVLGTALVFWAILGFGLSDSFRWGGAERPLEAGGYQAYFFPGILAMILLFTAIFSSFSLIEDRNEGFLQGVLVAPVHPGAIVLGKLLGGTTIATLQGALFLLLAPTVHIPVGLASAAQAIVVMIVVSFGLSGLGFCAAWWFNSVQGFHGVMNLVLMPMWFLSGAIFPSDGAHAVIRFTMALNPMTYGVAALRGALWPASVVNHADLPSVLSGLSVSVVFAAVAFTAAMGIARRVSARNLA